MLIGLGGIGTILSVGLIMVFLVWVVTPLFLSAEIHDARHVQLATGETPRPLQLLVEDSGTLAAIVDEDGGMESFQLGTGVRLGRQPGPEVDPTSHTISVDGQEVTLGYPEGVVRTAVFEPELRFLRTDEVPEACAELTPGQARVHDGALYSALEDGTITRRAISLTWADPIETGAQGSVIRLDRVARDSGSTLAVLTDRSELHLMDVRERKNLLTGKITFSVQRTQIPYDRAQEIGGGEPPMRVLLSPLGDSISLLWEDGRLARIDTRDPDRSEVAQSLDLLPEPDARVTAARFLLGRGSLMVGDSLGRVRGWFGTRLEVSTTVDGVQLANGYSFAADHGAVVALAPSVRTRLLAVGYADGSARIYHVTSGDVIAEIDGQASTGVAQAIGLYPKDDGLAIWTGTTLATWAVDVGYPEASFKSLFAPVWYEGYPEPEYVWQSSSGTDEFEPKLGMLPLIFGTLKATLYSMLFGAPIALLAAIYTSEFLDRRWRAPLKSLVEMMASLPSVVLGFLGALVLAPLVQERLAETLGVIVMLPALLLLGAYLWQLLPRATALRWAGAPRLVAILTAVVLALPCGMLGGPLLERMLFGGDIARWLDGSEGRATGGWFVLLLPLTGLVFAIGSGRIVTPLLRRRSHDWSYAKHARVDLVRFGLVVAGALVLALIVAKGLDLGGLDPRGSLVGTYVQRNALVVGFVMGFALLPIIYTLAEDALSSVPDHLRLASLGAGATPWQTAARVIVPTAMSGLFSALMMGLGRAVGETMVVLMAAGNTPIMDWNPFNGFRTLSANIAVELPEAVENSTHYRTLFLAALVLFAMTFLLNTIAELVRQRFRKRAVQL